MKTIRLARHITVVLVIKTAALYSLWAVFFSSPTPVGPAAVGEMLGGSAIDSKEFDHGR